MRPPASRRFPTQSAAHSRLHVRTSGVQIPGIEASSAASPEARSEPGLAHEPPVFAERIAFDLPFRRSASSGGPSRRRRGRSESAVVGLPERANPPTRGCVVARARSCPGRTGHALVQVHVSKLNGTSIGMVASAPDAARCRDTLHGALPTAAFVRRASRLASASCPEMATEIGVGDAGHHSAIARDQLLGPGADGVSHLCAHPGLVERRWS